MTAVLDPDADVFMRALGKRVRLLRLSRELTQDQLGEAAGISRSFVSQFEQGSHGIDVVRLMRLAAVLGLPLVDLLDLSRPVPLDPAA